MVRTTHWRKQRLRVIEGGRAGIASRPDASQPATWNFWPLVAILLNALLWAGIYWVISAFS